MAELRERRQERGRKTGLEDKYGKGRFIEYY